MSLKKAAQELAGINSAWMSPTSSLRGVHVDELTLEQQLQGMVASLLPDIMDLPPDYLIAVTNVMLAYQLGAGPRFTLKQIALPTPPDMESLLEGLQFIARTYLVESVLSYWSTLELMRSSIRLITEITEA